MVSQALNDTRAGPTTRLRGNLVALAVAPTNILTSGLASLASRSTLAVTTAADINALRSGLIQIVRPGQPTVLGKLFMAARKTVAVCRIGCRGRAQGQETKLQACNLSLMRHAFIEQLLGARRVADLKSAPLLRVGWDIDTQHNRQADMASRWCIEHAGTTTSRR